MHLTGVDPAEPTGGASDAGGSLKGFDLFFDAVVLLLHRQIAVLDRIVDLAHIARGEIGSGSPHSDPAEPETDQRHAEQGDQPIGRAFAETKRFGIGWSSDSDHLPSKYAMAEQSDLGQILAGCGGSNACPIVCTWIRLVVPGLLTGTPAVSTTRSPFFTRRAL